MGKDKVKIKQEKTYFLSVSIVTKQQLVVAWQPRRTGWLAVLSVWTNCRSRWPTPAGRWPSPVVAAAPSRLCLNPQPPPADGHPETEVFLFLSPPRKSSEAWGPQRARGVSELSLACRHRRWESHADERAGEALTGHSDEVLEGNPRKA